MLDKPAAQTLIDGLAAVALSAAVFVVARPGFASALRPRLAFAFGGLCLFFGARAAWAALDSHALGLLSLTVGCTLPVAALLLTEGLLRRHAPTWLKALICVAALAVALAILLTDGRAPASTWVLGLYILSSLTAVTALLLFRDRASLSRQENAGVEALIVFGAILTLLSLTDFLPGAPLGMSGVGAAIVAYALSANPSSSREARLALSNLVVICALTAAGTVPFAIALGMTDLADHVRLGAVVLAALLAVNAVLDARRRIGRSTRGFALALANADTTSLDAFLASLAGQPLLAGLRLTEGLSLADYDQPALGAAMAPRAVWTPAALRDAQTPIAPRARDELSDLMVRTEATHALLISQEPLRIALLTLPGAGPTDEADADLALFRKLAAVAARNPV